MNTYIIADTHFGHANIIKYCNRPFTDFIEMDYILKRNWNSTVGINDTVWHLGDFAMLPKQNIQQLIPQLNGRKKIVLGNHDRYEKQFYLDSGFEEVYEHNEVFFEKYSMSHHPLPNPTILNIHGHVHNTSFDFKSELHVCVCVELHDYKPILLNSIIPQI
jgi:calcineurin-like phosphoesterase family protein